MAIEMPLGGCRSRVLRDSIPMTFVGGERKHLPTTVLYYCTVHCTVLYTVSYSTVRSEVLNGS